MYISCGGNGTAMEPETGGYIPNNPLFGLPLDSPQDCPSACSGCSSCQENSTLPISGGLHGSDFDCGNCLDHNGILSLSHGNSHSNISGGYWGEDMNSFSSLPPLDIEPLPSLFNFSPTCGPPYKTEKPTHDVADVLLSLKHAVLRPSPEPQPMQMQSQNFCSPHQASLSYSVHPQMLLSPTHQSNSQNLPYSNNFYESPCSQHVPIYPSMSVNVSMNMTMHGYDNNLPMQCSQMQWGPQNSSSVNVLYPPVLSPNSYPATYSFTADFRPPTTSTSNSLNGSESMKHSPPPHQQQQHQQPQQHHYQPLQQPNYSSMQKPYFQSNIGYPHSPQSKSPIYNNNLNNSNNNTNISSNIINNAHQNHQPHQLKVKDTKSLNSTFEDEDSSDDTNGKTNLCRLCGKTYARPSTLKTHLRTHSGERPYRCGDCNKSFSQAANLTAHVRTHTGQKPFRCPICDRRFSQSSSVTTHMRTHSGERPYRCRACKKAFSDSSTLTKHLRIHSGEKPYQCKLCLLRFSQSGNLNRHMRVHGANGALIT